MEWNRRKIRPVGNLVKPKEFDFNDALKPLGEKRNNGFVWVPVQKIGSVFETESVPVSPTPTPTITSTPTVTPTTSVTPTVTTSPTNTPTTSVTPSITPTTTVTPTVTTSPTVTPTTTVTPTVTRTPTPSPLVSSVTYLTSGVIDNSQQTYTFNGVSIVGPGLIVVSIQTDLLGSASVSSVSIGGTNGTIAVQSSYNSTVLSCIASRRITGGTSVDITITLSANQGRSCRIGVYRLQNVSSDTVNTIGSGNSGGGTSMSANLASLGANACVVSSAVQQGNNPFTWTGPTENYDSTDAFVQSSSASIRRTASGTFNISTSWSNSRDAVMTSAAWI
jgi:hypothetical protein